MTIQELVEDDADDGFTEKVLGSAVGSRGLGSRQTSNPRSPSPEDVVEMLLFRMAFQRDPEQTRHSARVEVTGPQLRTGRRAAAEEEDGNETSPRAFAAGHEDAASSASTPTRKAVVFEGMVVPDMAPRFPTPLSRRPSSVSAAPGAPSALLVQAFHAWTARTFPAGDGRDVATLLGQNRQLAAALKRQEQLAAAGAASSIDAPHGAAETSSAVGEHEAEVGQLRTQLATAGAERLLLIERAWSMDVLLAQHSLFAASPCLRCGEEPPTLQHCEGGYIVL
ncbi:hypothetical protein T484DRAFT_2617148 [Baffinella frigidus]|nr:hypothetical protein T484DRAFT_2617148 [Cryptophyta sp. CCMP2293]